MSDIPPPFVRPNKRTHLHNLCALSRKLVSDRLFKSSEGTRANDHIFEGGDLLLLYVADAIEAPVWSTLGFSEYAYALMQEAENFVYQAIQHELNNRLEADDFWSEQ